MVVPQPEKWRDNHLLLRGYGGEHWQQHQPPRHGAHGRWRGSVASLACHNLLGRFPRRANGVGVDEKRQATPDAHHRYARGHSAHDGRHAHREPLALGRGGTFPFGDVELRVHACRRRPWPIHLASLRRIHDGRVWWGGVPRASGNDGRQGGLMAVYVDHSARLRVCAAMVCTERIQEIKATLHDNVVQVSAKLVVQFGRDFLVCRHNAERMGKKFLAVRRMLMWERIDDHPHAFVEMLA